MIKVTTCRLTACLRTISSRCQIQSGPWIERCKIRTFPQNLKAKWQKTVLLQWFLARFYTFVWESVAKYSESAVEFLESTAEFSDSAADFFDSVVVSFDNVVVASDWVAESSDSVRNLLILRQCFRILRQRFLVLPQHPTARACCLRVLCSGNTLYPAIAARPSTPPPGMPPDGSAAAAVHGGSTSAAGGTTAKGCGIRHG